MSSTGTLRPEGSVGPEAGSVPPRRQLVLRSSDAVNELDGERRVVETRRPSSF